MLRPLKILVLAGTVLGTGYFLSGYRIEGLGNLKIQPRGAATVEGAPEAELPRTPTGQPKKTIRVATANFGPLDEVKLAKPAVLGKLVQVIRQFDIVALQDLQARDQRLLVELLEQVNAEGRHYNFATPPVVGRDVVRQYSAFVFDSDTILIDRATVVSVDNREGRFRLPPLVASFQAKGPAPAEAFTFTLVNVYIPADRVDAELDLLAAVYRAVRDDGRNEDDILLLGDLEADEEHLGELARLPNLTCAISGFPTTTRGTRQADNILFDRRATTEYTRRCGVVDLMREFNLSSREAVEISEHLPVWAEFSIYEAGQPGHVDR